MNHEAWSQVDQAQFLNVYDTRGPSVLVYDKQYHVNHVDEKWFYLIKDGQKFYLAHDEKPPYISQQHKQSIPKVMFLCALARPQYIPEKRYMFDGKIGI